MDYILPKSLIADSPAEPRESSRMLKIDRKTGQISHHIFREIEGMLGPNDVLVLNKTKVFPARLFAKKITGGSVELLFIEEVKPGIWKALTSPGVKIGQIVTFKGVSFKGVGHDGTAALLETDLHHDRVLSLLEKYGKTPLPPYINSKESEKNLRREYQTVYAKEIGSVAAPTAGFHFTDSLLKQLKNRGVQIEYVTLHVGLGTFVPIKTRKLEDHPMHFEYYDVEKDVARRLNKAKDSGKRIIAVGTTSTRVLETLANSLGQLGQLKLRNSTNLFIFPPYKFKFVDALITNFHLPKSTLIALVSAFVTYPNSDKKFKDFGSSLIGKAYAEAVKKKYRFYSFGDATFIV